MIYRKYFFIAAIFLGLTIAHADSLDLRRGGNSKDVSLSGVSSGAAMAVQYAVAHSSSITGVGSIAGPGWGCADGRISQAINACMCGHQPVASKIDTARILATKGDIDPLVAQKPQALKQSYVFHSARDGKVCITRRQAW
jgi:poly(3-hydroxybutyrate) depolymerase